MKMIQKWSQKWAKNGPKMSTVNNPNKGYKAIKVTESVKSKENLVKNIKSEYDF